MEYLVEQDYSVLAPFIERFFNVVDKAYQDRITFDEFFFSVTTYCLFER